MRLTPKGWNDFQHYKDRSPAWIKLHRKILDDYVFACLPTASRALAPMLWLLASEYDDGKITADINEVAFRLRMNTADLRAALAPLIEGKFFAADGFATDALADRKPVAIPEREKEKQVQTQEQTETENPPATPSGGGAEPSKAKQSKLDLGPKPKPTRLAPDWKLSQKNTDDARATGLSEVQLAKESKIYRDYWIAAAGPKALKLDWDATWRNWCRRKAEQLGLVGTEHQEMAPAQSARSLAEWQKILRIYANTNNWLTSWGPAPGAPGCLVPPDLLIDPDDGADA